MGTRERGTYAALTHRLYISTLPEDVEVGRERLATTVASRAWEATSERDREAMMREMNRMLYEWPWGSGRRR
jgi:hypothetical protein